MKLIERYIAREILLPFTVVIIILVGLFASFSSARLLAGAITETVGIAALIKLVFLKTLIALEVLIPSHSIFQSLWVSADSVEIRNSMYFVLLA